MQKSPQQRHDYLTTILLAVIIFTASVRLTATEWTPDLDAIVPITFLSLLLGIILGASRFKKSIVIFLTLICSLIILPIQIINISNKDSLLLRLVDASERLGATFVQLSNKQPVDDHLFFISFLIFVFWIAGVYAGYVLLRYQNLIVALFPSTLIILIVQYYDQTKEPSLWSIGFYFFLILILQVRLNYKEDEKRWKKKNVFVDSGIGLDIAIITLSTVTIIFLLAWSIPSSRTEWAAFSKWWQSAQDSLQNTQRYFDNAFAAIEEKPVDDSGDLYKSRLFLGERPYQNEQVLFTVRVLDKKLIQRYYWKMRVYDTYKDGYWLHSQDVPNRFIPAMTEMYTPNVNRNFSQDFLFTNKVSSQDALIIVQQPISFSVNTRVAYVPLPEESMDINRFLAQPTLALEETYTVKSALTRPTIIEMRQAGTDYPLWVSERYLQLPEDFPEKIRELALAIAKDEESSYDKAFAITNYLRSQIAYNEKIPTPPRGKDPIEWFLFTQKEGFCNYSASAATVMLRSLDIPARMAVGFSEGDRDEDGNFLIQQGNAHTWVEVYFHDIGWVEFEPTSREPLLIRPSGVLKTAFTTEEDMLSGRMLNSLERAETGESFSATSRLEDISIPEFIVDDPEADRRLIMFWGMIILLMGVAILGIWYLNRKQVLVTRGVRLFIQLYERNNLRPPKWLIRLRLWSEASPISRAFYGINTSLRWLGEEIPMHYTPQERAKTLIDILPEKEDEITALLAEHQKALYTPDDGDLERAKNASFAIRWFIIKRKFDSL